MLFQSIFRSEGYYNLAPISLTNIMQNLGILCKTPFTDELCKNVLFSLWGPSVQYFDGVILSLSKHYPAGSSYKQFIHYMQIIATGKRNRTMRKIEFF